METSEHGMTSEMASLKKKLGHSREDNRLSQLGNGSVIIKGTGKADILRNDGKTESIKGGVKTQWALYCLNRVIQDGFFSKEEMDVIKKWVNFIPDDKIEWKKNRGHYSKNPHAIELTDIFKNNPIKLVNYFCGVNIVDYLVTEDKRDGMWRETPMVEFSNIIKHNIKNVYNTEGGKLVISGGDKNTILFELEIRKGSSHKSILFHSPLLRIIDCIK
jgi:hypothetical protein